MWELTDFETWLRATIIAAVGHQRVYNGFRAARTAVSPFVVFRFVPSADDVQGQGTVRIMSRPIYDITVCTKGAPTAGSEAMVGQFDAAISIQVTADAGSFRVSARRLNPLAYESPGATAEEFFVYRGGTYQFWVAGFSNN